MGEERRGEWRGEKEVGDGRWEMGEGSRGRGERGERRGVGKVIVNYCRECGSIIMYVC